MIYSMTGFANSHTQNEHFDINIELKSVNHRYFNMLFKLPEELRSLEQKFNTLISSYISRGKIECRIYLTQNSSQSHIALNESIKNQLIKLNDQLVREGNLNSMSVTDILKFPGVLIQNNIDVTTLETLLLNQLKETCVVFNQSRQREGEQLANHLLTRLDKMQLIIDQILVSFPIRIAEYTEKLKNRLIETLSDSIDENRINQEVTLFIQKMDIDEELSRLQSHITEVKRLLSQKQTAAIGKRLDFLMQEFNREANTLGSKSLHSDYTQASIELKVLIEQMREQIQNIE